MTQRKYHDLANIVHVACRKAMDGPEDIRQYSVTSLFTQHQGIWGLLERLIEEGLVRLVWAENRAELWKQLHEYHWEMVNNAMLPRIDRILEEKERNKVSNRALLETLRNEIEDIGDSMLLDELGL